jgi:hypothetical protein
MSTNHLDKGDRLEQHYRRLGTHDPRCRADSTPHPVLFAGVTSWLLNGTALWVLDANSAIPAFEGWRPIGESLWWDEDGRAGP